MDHLDMLKFANYAMAVLSVLGLLASLFGGGLQAFLLYSAGTVEVTEFMVPVGGAIIGALICFVMAFLYMNTGARVQWGGGRGLQTFIAVLSLCNCPIGTFYAAYAIWVVWIGEETKREFEE